MASAELKKLVEKADKLAFEKELGRKTTNVIEHPKADTLTITEEITRYAGDIEIVQRFYRHVADISKIDLNVEDEINYLKSQATYRALGMKWPGDDISTGGRIDAPEVVAPSEPAEVEAVESEEKPKAKAKGKSKAKAKGKATAKAETAEGSEVPLEEKPAKAKKPAKAVFNYENPSHVRFVGELVRAVLGGDWKKNPDNQNAVKDLIYNVLHGKVHVAEKDSAKPLDSFTKTVQDFLTERLDLAGDDADVMASI